MDERSIIICKGTGPFTRVCRRLTEKLELLAEMHQYQMVQLFLQNLHHYGELLDQECGKDASPLLMLPQIRGHKWRLVWFNPESSVDVLGLVRANRQQELPNIRYMRQ